MKNMRVTTPPSASTKPKNTARLGINAPSSPLRMDAQYDQAISENAGEDTEHDLRDAAAHEVPQDARSVLARSQRQHHQYHGERNAHHGHH